MINDIRVEGIFESAHRLETFPADHKCHQLHGHRWEVAITIRGEADPHTNIVMDYYEVQRKLQVVLDKVDHVYLNEAIPEAGDPTTENLSRWLWMELHRQGLTMLVTVELQESPGFGCIFRGPTPALETAYGGRRDCPSCKRQDGMYHAQSTYMCSFCGYREDG